MVEETRRHYRTLDAERITATLETLERRIEERFPDSGLRKITRELIQISAECTARVRKISKPHWGLRIAEAAMILALAAIVIAAAMSIHLAVTVEGLSELAQGIEASIANIVYLGVAIFFLFSLEARAKRKAALEALHELRSIVHIIDMHQLTKDPEVFLGRGTSTASSPKRTMTRFELSRYLDYCTELLSLTSKLAALHVQHLNDAIVLEAVNDIEELAGSLSANIWQKIMILDTIVPPER